MSADRSSGPERVNVQDAALEFLVRHCGYTHLRGRDLNASRYSMAEPILLDRLREKLPQINPGLSDQAVEQVLNQVSNPLAAGLLEANEKLYHLITRWVPVEEIRGRQIVGRSVRLIDYDVPENNEFLVVDEFAVKGLRATRYMDLTVFVNGIPVAVFECKRSDDPRGIERAVRDLLLYQDRMKGVPRLFYTVQLCAALKKSDARYGTVETPLDRYTEWKSVWPETEHALAERIGRKLSRQDILLAGLLRKENLLDLIRNFMAFDRQGGRTVKKMARYIQFEAVNEAVRRVTDDESSRPKRERGGIIWHTQGSGKSLTMLWLAVKLRRLKELENPTMLIVTDRRDLDRQITDTFTFCGFENPIRAERVSHLRKLLDGPSGQTVMTTVQKFRGEVDMVRGSMHPVLSDADNIFVLVDEAHRTEYGLFNAHLRRALPNACLLAFTGTPIEKTEQKFGEYIHTYTMPQSVEDESTVPILYESRMPELAVWGKQLDPIFDAQFAHLTEDQRRVLKQQEITEKRIAEAKDRVEKIAFDIAQHYRANFEPDGFKAQVATCSQEAGARYFHELSKYLPDRVALLISSPAAKDSALWDIKRRFDQEDRIIDQFKNEGVDKLAMIVVVDKYLTGFDAPIERVLYLDKPLKKHGLLQAVARVNRPLPERNKTWGLIVDYWGVSGFLDKALQSFSDTLQVQDILQPRNADHFYQVLRQSRKAVFALFPSGLDRSDVEPWLLALEPEDMRARFLQAYRTFYKALEQLLPDERALSFLGDLAWLRRIRREMVAFYAEDLVASDYSARVRELIDEHVRGDQVSVMLEPVPILDAEFSKQAERLSSSRAKASYMEHTLDRTIKLQVAENPALYESFRERLERIIRERKEQRIDDIKEFQLLKELRGDMIHEQGETAASLGFSEDAFAVFSILDREVKERYDGPAISQDQLKSTSERILTALKEEAVLDWTQKEDVQREMRRKVKRELRLAGWPRQRIEEMATTLIDLARVRLAQ